jgi:hypothetical protein
VCNGFNGFKERHREMKWKEKDKSCVVVHTCYPRSLQVEAMMIMSSRPAWSTSEFKGYMAEHSLKKKTEQKKTGEELIA